MKNLLKLLGLALLTITLAFTTTDKRTIVIDAGHGGIDEGNNGSGFKEKEIVLNIANQIKAQNKNSDLEIIIMRDKDEYIKLNERAAQINALAPDYVISLHTNASKDKKENGTQLYISDENKHKEKSGDLALKLFYSFDYANVGINKANYYMLKGVECPAVLVGLGFLTNEYDLKRLTTEKGQAEFVTAILSVIE